MIFQEPMMSLNPVYKVGQQIMEAIRLHQKVDKRMAKEIAIEALRRVRISAPEQRINEYPFQLSGGMRQRVMIAIALSCNPKLLIADEPTTALDVTIEAEILKLIKDLQTELGTSLMMITHDLGVIGEVTDDVVVMYVGKIVEKAKTRKLFEQPLHPYTKALFKSRPEIRTQGRLSSIKGSVPNPYLLPEGCSFEPRCDVAMDICKKKAPELFDLDGHYVSCWKYNEKEG
jgi:oligopeptide/dipeptide ABC transporter ATP-binding protein